MMLIAEMEVVFFLSYTRDDPSFQIQRKPDLERDDWIVQNILTYSSAKSWLFGAKQGLVSHLTHYIFKFVIKLSPIYDFFGRHGHCEPSFLHGRLTIHTNFPCLFFSLLI